MSKPHLAPRGWAFYAHLNTALDAATETLTFAILAALCEAGRAKDRLLSRCRTRAVCCWCGRTLRRRWCFWRRDTAENVTGGCCPACLHLHFPPPAVSPSSDLHGLADPLSARRENS